MAKVGTDHKTTIFGDAAEIYNSRLFSMGRYAGGDIRPDLYVDSEKSDLDFAVEVKGGKSPRGVSLVMAQLSYGMNHIGDWAEFFGRRKKNPVVNGHTKFVGRGQRVFYAATERVDGIRAKKLVGDYSGVRLQWGDVYVIPADLIFHYHAAVISRQLGESIGRTEVKLKRMIRRSVETGSSLSSEWGVREGYWVGLPFSSCHAIHSGTLNGTKDKTQMQTLGRFFRIARSRTDYDDYKRSEIKGPDGTTVHLIYDAQDEPIADRLKATVQRVRPVLDEIAGERKEVKKWFERDNVRLGMPGFEHHHNGGADDHRKNAIVRVYGERFGIDEGKLDLLERLTQWETEKQYERRRQREAVELENKLAAVPF